MTCFIINITERADGDGVRAQIQRFDGQGVTAYDLGLIAVFRDGIPGSIRIVDKDGNDV